MFVSFLGFSKGASTITKGFTYSLQFERSKFVFYKLFPNIMVHRNVDIYVVEWKHKLFPNILARRSVDLYAATWKHKLFPKFMVNRCIGTLRRDVDPYAVA